MPINAYTGLMGSGKSYECVSAVIVPAVKAGRRVVTNVDGINSDAIRAYCLEKFGIEMDLLGEVVHCTNADVSKADFFPHGSDAETFCKPGDLICIDEAWRFWGSDGKFLPEHKIFFREHRHYVHPESKVSCDLVLMVQDIGDLHRALRVVVEVTFRTTKIKTLGWQKTYRVEMWEGYKLTAKGRVSVENKRYDQAIFPLYSSYVGGSGKELQVDSRQNILRSPKLWLGAIGVILMFCWGIYTVLGFFNPSSSKDLQALNPQSKTVSALPAPSSSARSTQSKVPQHSRWRLAGLLQVEREQFVVIADDTGRVRLEHPSAFVNSGLLMVGVVDGEQITAWSGAKKVEVGR